MRPRAVWIVAIVCLASAAAFLLGHIARRHQALNVLLVSIDTLRPDHLGCYGYGKVNTPNIDLLAGEGFTFLNAVSSVPLTLPSHASMLTGLYPFSHGIRENGIFKLGSEFVTLAEALEAQGYSTAAFVGAFVLDSRYGLGQGFATYDDDMRGGRHESDFGYPERSASLVTDSALEWFKTVDQPFFCFVHYFDPHANYAPPGVYRNLYAENPYDGEIAFTDEHFGRLLAHLRETGLLRRTLVILVSDHGEGLGEHNEVTHGVLVYEPTLRVPFIVRIPESHHLHSVLEAPRTVDQTVRLIDIFPTVLDILDIASPGNIDGRSILQLIEGEGLPSEISYFESLYPYLAYRWSPLRGVRFNQWKYILAPEEELYDLRHDPTESENLAHTQLKKVEEFKAALALIVETESRNKQAAAARPNAGEHKKLRSLGYVDHGVVPIPRTLQMTGKNPREAISYISQYIEPGQEAFDRGNLDLAFETFTNLAAIDPMNPNAHVHLAKTLLQMKKYGEATDAYRRVLELDPANSTAYFHLANISQIRGMPEEALAYYDRALDILPDSPEALANKAGILIGKGLVDSAIAILDRALEIDPNQAIALFNLGQAYSSRQSYDLALGHFQRVLSIDERNLKALSNCAIIFLNKGDIDSTIAYFEKASEVAPEDPGTLVNLGSAYRQKGLHERAAVCFESALRVDPNNKLALLGLAGVRAAQGKPQECGAILKRILEIDPEFEPALEALKSVR